MHHANVATLQVRLEGTAVAATEIRTRFAPVGAASNRHDKERGGD
eukprot:COSAG01_NODE_23_length_37704_cov_30.005877_17_plen_45_part_00